MATFFRNSVIKEIGTVPVRILETAPASRITVIGLSLANLTGGTVVASILLQDDTSITGFYIKDVVIPAQSSLRAVTQGEKLILAPSNQLLVQANVSNALDAVVSYVEIV